MLASRGSSPSPAIFMYSRSTGRKWGCAHLEMMSSARRRAERISVFRANPCSVTTQWMSCSVWSMWRTYGSTQLTTLPSLRRRTEGVWTMLR